MHADERGRRMTTHIRQSTSVRIIEMPESASAPIKQRPPDLPGKVGISTIVTGDFNLKLII